MEYISMILLPRQHLVTPPAWGAMSAWDQYLMLKMLSQESDPIYQRSE